MAWSRPSLVLLAALISGCGAGEDPMAKLDERYTRIMTDLAKADRDAARNIRNREARKRKVKAENARSAFLSSGAFKAALAEAAESDDPKVQAKVDGYRRHQLIASSWTNEEKKEETRLLSQLDELNGVEATWISRKRRCTKRMEGSHDGGTYGQLRWRRSRFRRLARNQHR